MHQFRSRARLRALVGVTLLAGLSITIGPARAQVADPDIATPTFGVPRIVDPIHTYGEPDIGVNPKTGAVHVSGPQGTGTQRSIWNVSVDHGDSYRVLADLPNNEYPTAAEPTKSAIAPGGGDTEIVFDRNGKSYFTDLAALLCFAALTTPDDGATTPDANPHACPAEAATDDRQWMGVFDPAPEDDTISAYTGPRPLVYMSWNGTSHKVARSTDGLDFSKLAGAATGSLSAYPVVDQHTGKFLVPVGGGNGMRLAVGVPNAAGDLTFHYNNLPAGTSDNRWKFPVLTQDSARNLYVVWIRGSDWQVYYSWAPLDPTTQDWTDWSAPRKINTPPARVNVFPWAQAGGPGILDVAWYGTPVSLNELGSSGPSARAGQAWHVFFNQITDANSTVPVSHQVVATPHPMHYNDICMDGTGCAASQGNRNMADFFEVTVDPESGRARIVYNDTSNGLVQGVQDTPADHQGAALVSVITQNTGLNALTGQPLTPTETTSPISQIGDPTGDALFKPLGGTGVPSADITDLRVRLANGNIIFTVTTAGGLLGEAAAAAKVPFAELVLRWQSGNTLYHAGVEMPSGAPSAGAVYFAGPTKSVDLCSVSACKPNYLYYPPQADTARATGSIATAPGKTVYTITVPRTLVPTSNELFEEVMGFVTVSPVTYAKPQDNASAFADEVPVLIEGTKTFNFSAAAAPATDVPEIAVTVLLPLSALLIVTVVFVRRRRSATTA